MLILRVICCSVREHRGVKVHHPVKCRCVNLGFASAGPSVRRFAQDVIPVIIAAQHVKLRNGRFTAGGVVELWILRARILGTLNRVRMNQSSLVQ